MEHSDDAIDVRLPAVAFALASPIGQRAMTASAIAPFARGNLILDPTGTTLDLRDHVLSCRLHQPLPHYPPAPHAGVAVTFDNQFQTLTTVEH